MSGASLSLRPAAASIAPPKKSWYIVFDCHGPNIALPINWLYIIGKNMRPSTNDRSTSLSSLWHGPMSQ
jgi:hypothetical protein